MSDSNDREPSTPAPDPSRRPPRRGRLRHGRRRVRRRFRRAVLGGVQGRGSGAGDRSEEADHADLRSDARAEGRRHQADRARRPRRLERADRLQRRPDRRRADLAEPRARHDRHPLQGQDAGGDGAGSAAEHRRRGLPHRRVDPRHRPRQQRRGGAGARLLPCARPHRTGPGGGADGDPPLRPGDRRWRADAALSGAGRHPGDAGEIAAGRSLRRPGHLSRRGDRPQRHHRQSDRRRHRQARTDRHRRLGRKRHQEQPLLVARQGRDLLLPQLRRGRHGPPSGAAGQRGGGQRVLLSPLFRAEPGGVARLAHGQSRLLQPRPRLPLRQRCRRSRSRRSQLDRRQPRRGAVAAADDPRRRCRQSHREERRDARRGRRRLGPSGAGPRPAARLAAERKRRRQPGRAGVASITGRKRWPGDRPPLTAAAGGAAARRAGPEPGAAGRDGPAPPGEPGRDAPAPPDAPGPDGTGRPGGPPAPASAPPGG